MMVENTKFIQELLDNVIRNTTVIKNDLLENEQTHSTYILEKLNKAQRDLQVAISIAEGEE